jgi:DNA-binding transcriptional regulator YhcF (GntR family)
VVDRENHKLPAAYTHEKLGTMIGAGRVSVSRAFKELRDVGILERIAKSEG